MTVEHVTPENADLLLIRSAQSPGSDPWSRKASKYGTLHWRRRPS